tara:strand:+ start:749 stop:2170 length:1422 start_codon:yes stop_codon:yes gene_type:complete
MDKTFFKKNKQAAMGGDSSNLSLRPQNTQAQIQSHLAGIPESFEIDYMVVTVVNDSIFNLPQKSTGEPDEGEFGAITGKFLISEGGKLRKGLMAYPLDTGNFELPIPGETVPVIMYGDTYYYLNRKISHGGNFSYAPQLAGLIQTDKIEVQKKIIQYKSAGENNNKKLPLSGRGSKQINSRFGSSIIFDNNRSRLESQLGKTKPTLRISNNQSQQTPLFYIPSLGAEGSTILMTSGDSTEDFAEQVPLKNTKFNPLSSDKDTIVLDTDRLILQTQDGSVFMNSSDDFIINGRNVYINNSAAVRGEELQIYLETMQEIMETMYQALSKTNAAALMSGVGNKLKQLKERKNDYLAIDGKHPLKKKTLEERSRSADLYVDEPELGTGNITHQVATIYSIQGDVMVNEKTVKPKQKLNEGDLIETESEAKVVWKWKLDGSEYGLGESKRIVIQDPTEFPGGVEDITPPPKSTNSILG